MKIRHGLKIILISFLYYSGISALYSFCLRMKNKKQVRVLAFHDVPDREAFRSCITFLKEKYTIISPEDFASQKFDSKRINILLTFDDGYKTWHTNVLPVFQEMHIQGLFFITSGFIDTHGLPDREKEFCTTHLHIRHRVPLSWQEVNGLQAVGIIGGHTHMHPRISEKTCVSIQDEISTNTEKIKSHTHTLPTHFAFPYGKQKDISDDAVELLSSVYTYLYTTAPGFYAMDTKRIPRTMIDPDVSKKHVRVLISGVWDLFASK